MNNNNDYICVIDNTHIADTELYRDLNYYKIMLVNKNILTELNYSSNVFLDILATTWNNEYNTNKAIYSMSDVENTFKQVVYDHFEPTFHAYGHHSNKNNRNFPIFTP